MHNIRRYLFTVRKILNEIVELLKYENAKTGFIYMHFKWLNSKQTQRAKIQIMKSLNFQPN